jgi:phage terminase large subunit-like protein
MIPWLSAWTADDWAKAKAKMPPKDFTDLVQIYTHECWLDERRKLYSYYPDEGPLRRELYPKHMEFFAAGKVHQERAVIAANRCVSPWTPIETAGSVRQFRELLGETSFGVRSWADGSLCDARAEGVFLKSIEPAFRFHLDTGDFFDCSWRHRVLDANGGFVEVGRLLSAASAQMPCVLVRRQKAADSLANYGGDNHLRDVLLRATEDSGHESPQGEGGVRTRGRWLDNEGAGERKSQYSQPDADICPSDDPQTIADLCAAFQDPSDCIAAERYSYVVQELRPLLLSAFRSQSWSELSHHLPSKAYIGLWGGRAPDLQPFDLLLPLTPLKIHGANINYVVPIGNSPILDCTVPGVHNYQSGGVIHHNTGKSFLLGYEDTCHMTGWYPKWWNGRRFNRPIVTWIAGEDAKAVRESMQFSLLGPPNALGTGTIPHELIVGKPTAKSGVPEAYDAFAVKHVSGGVSRGLFKAYDQGRESFQAAQVDVIVLDEEPDKAIYTESLTRTMSTKPGEPNGIVMCGFTPLKGLSEVVLMYLPGGRVAKPA